MQHSCSSVQGFIMTFSKHPFADVLCLCVFLCLPVCECPLFYQTALSHRAYKKREITVEVRLQLFLLAGQDKPTHQL